MVQAPCFRFVLLIALSLGAAAAPARAAEAVPTVNPAANPAVNPAANPAVNPAANPAVVQVMTLADLSSPRWPVEAAHIKKEIADIEAAVPGEPVAKPSKPRKVLVFGRERTHPGSVQRCFVAIEALGRKTGAYETVWTDDPAAFELDYLRQFDAIVLNNNHENNPLLPRDFKDFDDAKKAAAKEREAVHQKNLFDFVKGGKGVVGIHAATALHWPELVEMLGGQYQSCYPFNYANKSLQMKIRVDEPSHPVCAGIGSQGFEIRDELYMFGPPVFARDKVRMLLTCEIPPPTEENVLKQFVEGQQKNPRKEMPVSWVKPYGQGRVFYCSLGHMIQPYASPIVMRHYLAGVQFAIGDLAADAASLGK